MKTTSYFIPSTTNLSKWIGMWQTLFANSSTSNHEYLWPMYAKCVFCPICNVILFCDIWQQKLSTREDILGIIWRKDFCCQDSTLKPCDTIFLFIYVNPDLNFSPLTQSFSFCSEQNWSTWVWFKDIRGTEGHFGVTNRENPSAISSSFSPGKKQSIFTYTSAAGHTMDYCLSLLLQNIMSLIVFPFCSLWIYHNVLHTSLLAQNSEARTWTKTSDVLNGLEKKLKVKNINTKDYFTHSTNKKNNLNYLLHSKF